jgi:hypothetical protein
LIPFTAEGHVGFVEPLWDYEERSARVAEGEVRVTAVMVGRLPPGFRADERAEWFPIDLVTLLALAGGRDVGVPFVELRGAAGELVARMHIGAGTPGAIRRSPLIDESIDRSTGDLLTAFLSSPHHGQVWMRVALRHLRRAFAGELTIEDRLGHLFRVVEGMTGALHLKNSRPLELSDETRARVDAALEECATQIDAIRSEAPEPDRARLGGVIGRINDVQLNRPSLQTQLLELVDHAQLADASWLRQFEFRAKIKPGKTSWAAVASHLRNRIFHSGFINFEQYDSENIVRFMAHLSDVLCRVVFALIGFRSSYRPPCGAHNAVVHETPDWALPDRITAELFGYID